MNKPRIAVVTPLFPFPSEPYRGSFVHSTVVELQHFADVKVYCPVATYPNVPMLAPVSYDYRKPDFDYCPPGVQSTTYFEYPAVPILSRPLNAYLCSRALVPLLRADRPDLVLAYWLFPEGYGAIKAAKRIGVPCVVGALGTDLRVIRDKVSRHLTKRCIAQASKVVTVSEELRRQAIALGCDTKKVCTILNGCDTAVFHPASRTNARELLGIPQDSELVLFVGHLIPTKGVRELLSAIVELASARPKLNLAFVGEGRLASELASTAAREGVGDRVHFPGPCSRREVASWMSASNVFSLPSYSEGCPNVVLEALSCNLPVVATDVGGIPEIINSQCGYLIPPRNVNRLSEALQMALDKDWGLTSIFQSFQRGWDRVAEETFNLCLPLISEDGSERNRPVRLYSKVA